MPSLGDGQKKDVSFKSGTQKQKRDKSFMQDSRKERIKWVTCSNWRRWMNQRWSAAALAQLYTSWVFLTAPINRTDAHRKAVWVSPARRRRRQQKPHPAVTASFNMPVTRVSSRNVLQPAEQSRQQRPFILVTPRGQSRTPAQQHKDTLSAVITEAEAEQQEKPTGFSWESRLRL